MPKPRRIHPAFDVIEGSPQGAAFLSILMLFLDEEMWWQALEQTADGSIVFLIDGTTGRGVLVEAAEHPEGDSWLYRWGFRLELAGHGTVLQMELLARRWDPWLHSQRTGDRSLLDAPASGRRSEQEQRDRKTGSDCDQFRMTVLPEGLASRDVCGVPVDQIDAMLERFAEKGGEGAREVARVHLMAGGLIEPDLLHGRYPRVD